MGVALLAGNGTDERQRFTSDQIQVVVQRRHMVRMVKPTEIDPAAPQPTHDSRAVARIDDVVLTRLDHEGRALDARQQIVRHGHVMVNGKRVDIPSFLVGKNQKIEIQEKSRKIKRIQEAMKSSERRAVPQWLSVDREHFAGTILDFPKRQDISEEIQEQLIVELYSK